VQMSFYQVNMFVCLEWSSQQISTLRSMFQMSVQRAFAMFVNYDTSGPHFLESATTLVHAFVTSRIDYCNAAFVWVPKSVTNKLQRVLNAAVRVVSGTRKFDCGLMQPLHANLQWLEVPERIKYKLCMMMRRCQGGTAPQYLVIVIHWSQVADIAS